MNADVDPAKKWISRSYRWAIVTVRREREGRAADRTIAALAAAAFLEALAIHEF